MNANEKEYVEIILIDDYNSIFYFNNKKHQCDPECEYEYDLNFESVWIRTSFDEDFNNHYGKSQILNDYFTNYRTIITNKAGECVLNLKLHEHQYTYIKKQQINKYKRPLTELSKSDINKIIILLNK